MEHFFDNRDEAAVSAAGQIATLLTRRLETQGEASLIASGGTSPVRCFEELARHDIAWANVFVVPSDERWVDPDHADSNEKLIRERLLTGYAAEAKLKPLYAADTTVESRCEALDAELKQLPFPFAAALVGMGDDGHFASLFPDASSLKVGLDVDTQHLCVPVDTAASPHRRISLTLAALSRSDEIVLLFFGDDKKQVYDRAKDATNGYPVSRLLLQKRAPVHVFWAP